MNTHSAHITGKNFNAFIDGIPDTCQHVWNGDTVLQSASGKLIYWHTYRQWASYTHQMRNRLIYEYHTEIDDSIVMETVTCSKCKKTALENDTYMGGEF